jgi:hypothetical protein
MSAKEEVNVEGAEAVANMSLMDIIEGENDRGIPTAKFVDDLGAFAESFSPPASAELLIGAYTELHTKYKSFEITLTQKRKLSLSILALVARDCFAHIVVCPTFIFRTTFTAKSTRAREIVDTSEKFAQEERGRRSRYGKIQSR